MVAAQTNSKDKATADLLAQIEALRAENAKLKERNNARLSLTVSEKGCVFNLRPWTLPQQPEASGRGCSAWLDQIKAFIEQNKDKLPTKE